MNSLQHDSEWMTQYVAAVSVPNSRQFISVHDKNGQLMLFSLGTDSKLYVSSLDSSGNRVVRDLGQQLGFPASYVAHAFDVAQDAGSKLYITVALQKGSDSSKSLLYLLRPLGVIETDFTSTATDLEPHIMDGSGTESPKVMRIFSAPAVSNNYCPVVFSFKDELHHAEDLASASVSLSGDTYSWTKKSNVRLPVNAEKILAVQPGVMKYGRKTISGHAVLHIIQGKKAIIFMSIDAIHDLDVSLKEPSDATPADPQALAAVQTPDGFSDILAGGTGLFRFDGKTLATPKPQKVTDEGVFSSIKNLQVTTSSSGTSVWASNINDGIGYMSTDVHFNSPNTAPVQVVPDYQGGYFAPFKSTPNACEAFVFANKVGNVAMLEQGGKSKVWKQIPIIQPSLETVTPVPSYMTQIKPLSALGGPLLNHPVILKTTGDTSVIVNGRCVVANEKGVAVVTDQSGLLTLTVPTDDLSTPTFTVSDASPATMETKALAVDPATKIYGKLSKIHHKEDLDIDLGPGKGKLLDGTKLGPTQIEGIANSIGEAMKSKGSIERGETPLSMPLKSCRGFNAQIIQGSGGGARDMLWAAWHWLEQQAEKIASFVVNGLQVLVQIGETLYQWVMETVEQVGKVLSFIFKKLLELGEKLIQWLAFIFNWGDIKDTRDSILNIVNDALDEGPNALDSLKSKSGQFFESLKSKVSGSRPSDAQMEKLGIEANEATGSKDASKNPAGNSMAANWAVYQFNHGGGRDASNFLHAAFNSEMLDADERKLFTEVDQELQNVEGKYKDTVQTRSKALLDDYGPKGQRSLNAKQAHDQTPSNFLTGCIDGVEKLTSMILNLIKSIVNKFKGIITTPINVPIFSYLYKTFISPGHDLTILDVLALVIAIPATIVAKLLTGKKPPTIARGKFATIIKNLVAGNSKTDADFNKFAAIIGGTTFVLAVIISVPESLSSFSTEKGHLPEEFSLLQQRPPPTASLAVMANQTVLEGEGKGKVTTDHFLDACVLIYSIHSIPDGKEKPGYTLRVISWIVSMFNAAFNIVLHFITALTSFIVDKVRGVLDAILQAIVFALSVTASVLEINTKDWKGKDDTASGLDIASQVFLLLGTWCSSLEKLLGETDPPLELLVKIGKYASYGLAIIMIGTKIGIHVSRGDLTDLPFVGDI